MVVDGFGSKLLSVNLLMLILDLLPIDLVDDGFLCRDFILGLWRFLLYIMCLSMCTGNFYELVLVN